NHRLPVGPRAQARHAGLGSGPGERLSPGLARSRRATLARPPCPIIDSANGFRLAWRVRLFLGRGTDPPPSGPHGSVAFPPLTSVLPPNRMTTPRRRPRGAFFFLTGK